MASPFGPVPSYNSYESETLVNELNMAPEELLEDQVCVCVPQLLLDSLRLAGLAFRSPGALL